MWSPPPEWDEEKAEERKKLWLKQTNEQDQIQAEQKVVKLFVQVLFCSISAGLFKRSHCFLVSTLHLIRQQQKAQAQPSGDSAWEEHVDDDSGDIYYYNRQTGASTWIKPSNAAV